jgi:hypothetical protein
MIDYIQYMEYVRTTREIEIYREHQYYECNLSEFSFTLLYFTLLPSMQNSQKMTP